MFQHFEENTRDIITQAQVTARNAGNTILHPNHVLAVMVTAKEMGGAFQRIGIDVSALKPSTLLDNLPTGEAPSKRVIVSEAVKNAVSQALRTSMTRQRRRIDPDALLYGILTNSDDDETLVLLYDAGYSGDPESVFSAESAVVGEPDGATEENSENPLYDNLTRFGQPRAERQGTGTRLKKKQELFLDNFADNLTQKALDGKLDPVVGRSKEVKRVVQIMARRNKNNPILIGEPGVGKTAIVEGLAQMLLTDDAPKALRNKRIYTLDLTSVVAGARYRGDFEERMKKIMKEVTSNPDIVLFIDEIHTLVGSGNGEGGMDGGNIMKPALSRGELQVIGATTFTEYKKYFEKDAALERRFQPVKVMEPTVEETVEILFGLRDKYEDFHEVTITDEALKAASELSHRYLTDRFLPDKAIDLVDEASARVKLDTADSNEVDLSAIDNELEQIAKDKGQALARNDYSKVASLSTREMVLIQERQDTVESWKETNQVTSKTVTGQIIADLLSETTGIPVSNISENEGTKLLRMEKELHTRVIGQKEAVKVLSRTIRRQRTGLKDPKRPIGSFIFAGPTGVGKTELAKTLSEFLFNSEDSLITLDMSEYSEKHTVARLFGAPPGYVGYEEGGQLTERVRQNPFSVVLFDEIEKAHPDVFDSLLQVLEEGRLTDGQGRVVDFKNTVVIMTTNLGSAQIISGNVGFQISGANGVSEYNNMRNKVMGALKENMRPEFLNRVDEVVVFPHLTEPEILQIVDIFLGTLNDRLTVEGYSMNVTDEAKAHLAKIGYDKALGARPLRRAIQREIENPVSEAILFGKTNKKGLIKVDVKNEQLTFNGATQEQFEAQMDALDEVN